MNHQLGVLGLPHQQTIRDVTVVSLLHTVVMALDHLQVLEGNNCFEALNYNYVNTNSTKPTFFLNHCALRIII